MLPSDANGPQYRTPPWLAPPQNELPATVGLDVVLVADDAAVISVSRAEVYSDGYLLVLQIGCGARTPVGPPFLSDDDDHLRLGFVLVDGTILRVPEDLRSERPLIERPDDPQVRWTSGAGGGAMAVFRFWLWPLPRAAVCAVACSWPAMGMTTHEANLDSARIIEARSRAVCLWQDQRPLPPSDEDVVV